MSSADSPKEHRSPEELRKQLTRALEEAVDSLEGELRDRISQTRDSFQHLVEDEVGKLAAEVRTEEAPTPVSAGAFVGLKQAVAGIDRANTQAEVLNALLDSSSAHAPRVALLLTQKQGLQGWGGSGFGSAGESVAGASLDYAADSAWNDLKNTRGSIRLTERDCRKLQNFKSDNITDEQQKQF